MLLMITFLPKGNTVLFAVKLQGRKKKGKKEKEEGRASCEELLIFVRYRVVCRTLCHSPLTNT